MQVQEIDNLAPLGSYDSSQQEQETDKNARRRLPIDWLEKFERVESQFSSLHVQFESAIALCPSNFRFQSESVSLAIMPMHQGRSLKVSLKSFVSDIEVVLVGSQAINLSALNNDGHCVAKAQTEVPPDVEGDTQYVPQRIVLDTQGASVVRIDSRSPFIMTDFTLKYS
ncbi:hypothetical protein PN498_24470 [Oscillatoria sp. CS-180]|uniref:hypothetical protein n=1 Tax=Oscillatoria sp. CS-180 TaxID=3021720 RepID=UPI00232DFE66|nr:hypothetical protein [Oscillatoria sp. CS-180]MDB9529170.1 hypothetical protein [Oscillatoria sp. CS-180]